MALVTLGVTVVLLTTGKEVFAHCDTLDGPVVGDARMAIEKGDVSGLLKWVTKEHEVPYRHVDIRCLIGR